MNFSSYDDVVSFHDMYLGRTYPGLLTMRYPHVVNASALPGVRETIEGIQKEAKEPVLLSMGHIDQLCQDDGTWGPAISHESGRILNPGDFHQETLKGHAYAEGQGAEFLLFINPGRNMDVIFDTMDSMHSPKIPSFRVVVAAPRDAFVSGVPEPV